jgi:hypothetical protein
MTTDSEFVDAIAAIRAGDVATLQRLLADNPGLAASRLGGIANGRTPLHVVADWPGYFPNGPKVVRMLIEAGWTRPAASGLGRTMSSAGSATRALSLLSSQSDRASPRFVTLHTSSR